MFRKIILLILLGSFLVLIGCEDKEKTNEEIIVSSALGDITKEDFYQEMKNIYGQNVLNNMISKMLITKAYPTEDEEIENSLETFKLQFENEEEYQNYLEQNNIDEEFLKEDLAYSQSYRQALIEDANMTEENIKKYTEENESSLRQVDVSHILLTTEAEALQVLEEIKNGLEFEEAAKKYSQDGTSEMGGNLGWITKGEVAPEFADAAFDLKVGELSEPVQTVFGYHIIKVNETRNLDMEEDRAIVEQLYLSEHGSLSQEFILELLEKYDVQVLDETLVDAL